MRQLYRRITATVFWVAAALSTQAADAADDPMTFLRESVEEVMRIVYDEPDPGTRLSERLYPVLRDRFDLAGITRRAVGRPWLKFTPEQREKAVELFSTLVLRTYADRFEPKHRPKIDYGQPVQLNETRWELPTQVEYEGKTYAVAYRVQRGRDGWRVYDVIIEGVSMVGNYRAQFAAILQKGGAVALLDALAANIAKGGQSS
ncbi:MAG: ABC transporter substrate-binding protein [Verrucomicrobia bacterium]|nr:MAG: ABC transporter substrate-binding protein [Verrucomicrobiota bacterium]